VGLLIDERLSIIVISIGLTKANDAVASTRLAASFANYHSPVIQVNGGSQSFNVVNQTRVPGRWMRMLTTPNQSSVAKAFLELDEADRMKRSAYFNRVVDV